LVTSTAVSLVGFVIRLARLGAVLLLPHLCMNAQAHALRHGFIGK